MGTEMAVVSREPVVAIIPSKSQFCFVQNASFVSGDLLSGEVPALLVLELHVRFPVSLCSGDLLRFIYIESKNLFVESLPANLSLTDH